MANAAHLPFLAYLLGMAPEAAAKEGGRMPLAMPTSDDP